MLGQSGPLGLTRLPLSCAQHAIGRRLLFQLPRLTASKFPQSRPAQIPILSAETPSYRHLRVCARSGLAKMAPRRSAEGVHEPRLAGLQFNEPLSWRAGKPIATSELLRRLEALAIELRDMEQEDTDKDSLTHVAKELAGQNLLGHKDKGVRSFTACCLVDILRICAPDAPFTATMLKVCVLRYSYY
jgi:hypothetical protein